MAADAVAAVPSFELRLTRLGVALLCLKLALVPLALDPASDVPFVLPRALLSHGLSYVLFGILLGLFILDPLRLKVRRPLDLPVIAFFAVNLLATVFAVNPGLALFGAHERMLGLASVADGVVTYFAVASLLRTRRDVVAVLLAVFAASVIVMAYELVQIVGKDPFTWTLDGSQRPFSTIGQPTTLGLYLVTLAAAGFAFGVLTSGVPRWVRGVAVGHSGLLLVGAALTQTRSVAVGAAAAAGVFVILLWLKHPDARARRGALVTGLGAAAVLAGLLWFTPLGARFAATVDTPVIESGDQVQTPQLEESAAIRVEIYKMALGMVGDRPLLGYGPGNFPAGVPSHRPDPAPTELRYSVTTSAHSWVADVAVGTGVIGLLVFLALLVTAALEVVRAPFNVLTAAGAMSAAALLGAGLTTINALETEALFWLALAAIASASGGSFPLFSSRPPGRSRRGLPAISLSRRVIAGSLVIASFLLMAAGISAFGASRLALQSVRARTPATSGTAIQLASRAIASDPNRAEYWKQLALAYAAASRWADASSAFQRGAKLAPYDIRFLTDDIQVQLVLAAGGDRAGLGRASDLAALAVRLDPNNPRSHLSSAQVAEARGDAQQAAESIGRALALDAKSTSTQLYTAAARMYLAAGKVEDAIRVGREGLAVIGPVRGSLPIRVDLARALASNGRVSEAITILDQALLISPEDADALRLRAQLQGK